MEEVHPKLGVVVLCTGNAKVGYSSPLLHIILMMQR